MISESCSTCQHWVQSCVYYKSDCNPFTVEYPPYCQFNKDPDMWHPTKCGKGYQKKPEIKLDISDGV